MPAGAGEKEASFPPAARAPPSATLLHTAYQAPSLTGGTGGGGARKHASQHSGACSVAGGHSAALTSAGVNQIHSETTVAVETASQQDEQLAKVLGEARVLRKGARGVAHPAQPAPLRGATRPNARAPSPHGAIPAVARNSEPAVKAQGLPLASRTVARAGAPDARAVKSVSDAELPEQIGNRMERDSPETDDNDDVLDRILQQARDIAPLNESPATPARGPKVHSSQSGSDAIGGKGGTALAGAPAPPMLAAQFTSRYDIVPTVQRAPPVSEQDSSATRPSGPAPAAATAAVAPAANAAATTAGGVPPEQQGCLGSRNPMLKGRNTGFASSVDAAADHKGRPLRADKVPSAEFLEHHDLPPNKVERGATENSIRAETQTRPERVGTAQMGVVARVPAGNGREEMAWNAFVDALLLVECLCQCLVSFHSLMRVSWPGPCARLLEAHRASPWIDSPARSVTQGGDMDLDGIPRTWNETRESSETLECRLQERLKKVEERVCTSALPDLVACPAQIDEISAEEAAELVQLVEDTTAELLPLQAWFLARGAGQTALDKALLAQGDRDHADKRDEAGFDKVHCETGLQEWLTGTPLFVETPTDCHAVSIPAEDMGILDDINRLRHEAQLLALSHHLAQTAHASLMPLTATSARASGGDMQAAGADTEDSKERAEMMRLMQAVDTPARLSLGRKTLGGGRQAGRWDWIALKSDSGECATEEGRPQI